jgi:putative ABC transport system permease protein
MITRNLSRRPLATGLTTLSIALGVGLFAAIGSLREASQDGFERSASICDLVVGAKGSPMQLVMNSLYHIGQSPGLLTFEAYEQAAAQPGVQWAIPILVGDSFRGRRIVGTTSAFFEDLRLAPDDTPLRLAEGRAFEASQAEFSAIGDGDHKHTDLFQAVLGAEAADYTGLALGSTFIPAHDLQGGASAKKHTEAATTVIGILQSTGTPLDRGIYISASAFYEMDGHGSEKGLSAVLLRTRPGFYHIKAWREINARLDAQAAQPAVEIRNLFSIVGKVDQILSLVAVLVIVVALLGTLVAIYNTMGARRKEFAVLRALGAPRRTLLTLIVGESAAIAGLGALLGLALAALLAWSLGGWLQNEYGIAIRPQPGARQFFVFLAVVLAGSLAGLVPALSAYRTEATRHLSGMGFGFAAAVLLLPLGLGACSEGQSNYGSAATTSPKSLADLPMTTTPQDQWWQPGILNQLISEAPQGAYKTLVGTILAHEGTAADPFPVDFDFLGAWRFEESLRPLAADKPRDPFPKHVRFVDGAKVRMVGFMLPDVAFEDIRDFHLVRSLWGCCFGAPPRVNELVRVHLPKDSGIDYTYNTLELSGTLRLTFEMEDGIVLDLYHLDIDPGGLRELDYFDPGAPAGFDPQSAFQGAVPIPTAAPPNGGEIGY